MSVLLNVVLLFYFLTYGHNVQCYGVLQNVQFTNQCLRVKGSSFDNNAALELAPCNLSQTDQQLNVEDFTNYANIPGQIKFLFNNKCLTVNMAGTSNGDSINQYNCWTGASNQLWKILGTYKGNFQIQNVRSSKCLTAEIGGAYTDQWDCLGEAAAPHQTWRIIKPSGHNGVFAFENFLHSGKCLNAAGISGTSSNLNVYNCDTTSKTQLFAATNLASISGSIVLYQTDLCLNVYEGSQANGGQIGLYSCSTTNDENEVWGLKPNEADPSIFQIVSGFSGKCLTAESSGAWIDQWDCYSLADAPHQWWKLKNPSSAPSGLPTTGSLLESAVHRNKCLRIQSRSGDNNANMQLMSCNPADSAQVLNMNSLARDDLSSTAGAISIQSSSKCLTVNGGSANNGAFVNQYDCVNPVPGNQQWKLIRANNDGYEGLFELQNVGSSKCLTAEGNGEYTDQWDCYHYKDAPHQFWKIRQIDGSSSGSQDNFSARWTCSMSTGLMDAPEYKNLTCGLWCVYEYDADGAKGFSGGYCYKGWWGKRYCACANAPRLQNSDIKLYKEVENRGPAILIGSRLYTRADCVSFNATTDNGFDNGELKSIVYAEGVCLKLWSGYGCTGGSRVFRSSFYDHDQLTDVPNHVGSIRSISREFC